MLLHGVTVVPLEASGETFSASVRVLERWRTAFGLSFFQTMLDEVQRSKELLELVNNAVFLFRVLNWVVLPLVDSLPQLGSHEESLKQAVHVASGTLVS